MAEDSSSAEETEVSASIVANSRVPLGSSDSLLPGLSDDIATNCLARVPISDYLSLSCVNKKYNKLINGGELFSLRKELGIVEYLVFMLCDPTDWLMFSPMKKKWMSLPKIPGDNLDDANKESLAVDDELLVFGRELFGFVIWKYSLRSRSWVKCERMHQRRWLFASGSLGGIAIVAGGTDFCGNRLASAELYDSSSGKWEMLPNMHCPRNLCSAFFMDGKFYVLGGMSSASTSLTCGEEFDLETRKWRKIEGMCPNVNLATLSPPLFVVVNNELFVVEYGTNMVKKYEKVKNRWEVMGRLPPMGAPANEWGVACGDQVLAFCSQEGVHGKEIVVKSWSVKLGTKDGNLEWKVLGVKENIGGLVYNCAVMGV